MATEKDGVNDGEKLNNTYSRRAFHRIGASLTRRNVLQLASAGAVSLGGLNLFSGAARSVTTGGPPNQDNWSLVFEDDFDAGELNTNNWDIGWGWGTGTNNSPTKVLSRHVNVHDSNLVLTASHEDWDSDGVLYAGGVNSKNKVTFGPGTYHEARIKFMPGEGFLNAFWSKPNSEAWPPEIDAVELIQDGSGSDDTHQSRHHVHYSTSGECGDGSTHRGPGNSYIPGDDLTKNYHIYGLEWQPDRITHYVDGTAVWETTDSTVIHQMEHCSPQYLMHSLHLDKIGTTDKSISWDSKELLVDWTRVWEYTGSSGGSDGGTSDDEHYFWARSADGTLVEFAFEASGGDISLDSTDYDVNYWVADDRLTAGGSTTKTSSLPGFWFYGDVTDLKYSGPLEVFIDDQQVDPDSLVDESEPGPEEPTSLPNTLTIDGSAYSGTASYSFRVSGEIEPTDTISSEDEISGSTAEGAVGSGEDTYEFSGDVTSLALDGGADILINGIPVNLLIVERHPDSHGRVKYTIETSGRIIKADVPSATMDGSDSTDGGTAFGKVKDEVDAYWVIGGDVIDVSTFGGDVETRLDGNVVDFTD